MLKKADTKETAESLDDLVAKYVKLRDHIDNTEELVKKHLQPFKAKKDEITADLLKLLDDQGTVMARTKHGTVSARVRRSSPLTDPEIFMDFVRENDLLELLDRRANTEAVVAYANEHEGVLPPGVKINAIRYVGVLQK